MVVVWCTDLSRLPYGSSAEAYSNLVWIKLKTGEKTVAWYKRCSAFGDFNIAIAPCWLTGIAVARRPVLQPEEVYGWLPLTAPGDLSPFDIYAPNSAGLPKPRVRAIVC